MFKYTVSEQLYRLDDSKNVSVVHSHFYEIDLLPKRGPTIKRYSLPLLTCIYFSYAINRTGTFKAHETGSINYPSSYNNPRKEDLQTQFADSAGKVYQHKSQVIYSKPQP